MYRTDHAHQWQRTEYAPMSSTYARTLYDEAALLMTGDTRPAPFGHTKDGDLVEVRSSGFAVDINTDAVPLEEIDARIMPLAEPWHLPHMGQRPNDAAAEIESARIAGARMGGGMQDVSRPVPLEHDRSGQYLGHVWANRVMLALVVLWVGYYVGKVFG